MLWLLSESSACTWLCQPVAKETTLLEHLGWCWRREGVMARCTCISHKSEWGHQSWLIMTSLAWPEHFTC